SEPGYFDGTGPKDCEILVVAIRRPALEETKGTRLSRRSAKLSLSNPTDLHIFAIVSSSRYRRLNEH
ncbi:hypothetical protein FRC00_001351, partial [Tulasnella sp. 408]